jgi:dCTP deaminase
VILTDREIQIAIEAGSIAIDPAPRGEAYSSTSVDLTLDGTLSEYRTGAKGVQKIADPALRDYDHEEVARELLKEVVIDPTDGWVFKPDRLVLAWTAEYVELKPHARLAGRVEGKSGLARLGIAVHVTAPTIHAGFEGQIRLEMFNHGAIPVRLRAGMRICQLILEQTLGTPVKSYKGRFAGQTPTGKKG